MHLSKLCVKFWMKRFTILLKVVCSDDIEDDYQMSDATCSYFITWYCFNSFLCAFITFKVELSAW